MRKQRRTQIKKKQRNMKDVEGASKQSANAVFVNQKHGKLDKRPESLPSSEYMPKSTTSTSASASASTSTVTIP